VPSAYYAEFARRLAGYADLLRRPAERDRYARLAARIADAFDAAFYDAAAGVYRESPDDDEFAQTAQVLPLAFELAPAARRDALITAVVADVTARGGNLATGIVGTRYLLKELTRSGRVDVAYGIATQTDRPSWGEWLTLGYTSLLEAWGPAVRSQDHHMFGSIGQWMIEDLAGIEPLTPGFGEVELRPEVPDGLGRVAASVDTVRGTVGASWRVAPADGAFELSVLLPPGATGVVHVPAARPDDVSEDTGDGVLRPALDAPGVTLLRSEAGRVVLRVGSGSYRFVVD
jgi:alpha-L-rhamnosidase